MSRRHRSEKNHRFPPSANDEKTAIMDTSIGSDGERSDNDYDAEDVTPSTTPISETGTKLAKGQRANQFVFNLKFSIENILKPDFGPQTRNGTRGGSSDTSGSPPTFATTPSPLSSPHCIQNGQHQTTGRNSTSENLLSTVGNGNTPAPPAGPPSLWPAWVYCTRYSDRPSSGPRCRRMKRSNSNSSKPKQDEKRPRTAFTVEQLSRLKTEFQENRYLTEKRRQDLARELGLNESQIKIWFQNKRAKIKKQTGGRNILALHLMAQGLYNHATVPIITDSLSPDEDEMDNDESDRLESNASK